MRPAVRWVNCLIVLEGMMVVHLLETGTGLVEMEGLVGSAHLTCTCACCGGAGGGHHVCRIAFLLMQIENIVRAALLG